MGITAYLNNHEPVFISSWKGFQVFSDALHTLGSEHFQMILAQLPDGDEGETVPEKAAVMLQELQQFEEMQTHLDQAVLVDSERADDISMGSHTLNGVLSINRQIGYEVGFNEKGFFVRDRLEMDRILFQAMRVQQTLIELETQTVEYLDLDSGQTFRCAVPFGKTTTEGSAENPRMLLQQFHVELRPMPPNRFAYILSPLKMILEACVQTEELITWG